MPANAGFVLLCKPTKTYMSFDLNNLVRSAVIALIGLSVTIPVGGEISARGKASRVELEKSNSEVVLEDIVNKLTAPCIDYMISKVDSKLERTAKNTIDDYFGGAVDHKAVCDYVLG
jgi:hypothetical protein